jgi:hypothetical protein
MLQKRKNSFGALKFVQNSKKLKNPKKIAENPLTSRPLGYRIVNCTIMGISTEEG